MKIIGSLELFSLTDSKSMDAVSEDRSSHRIKSDRVVSIMFVIERRN
jgi:hypothetical protein